VSFLMCFDSARVEVGFLVYDPIQNALVLILNTGVLVLAVDDI
jgi:hypothetical protein